MGLGRRLIGWIAAYALILHAALAGVVATQIAAASVGNAAAHSIELCLTGPDGGAMPGHGRGQHENCAISCITMGSSAPALALAVLALLFAPFAQRRIVHSFPIARFDLLRRAGLGSRAPPLPA